MPKVLENELTVSEELQKAIEENLIEPAVQGFTNGTAEDFNKLADAYPKAAKEVISRIVGVIPDEQLETVSGYFKSAEMIEEINNLIFEKNQLTSIGTQDVLTSMTLALLSKYDKNSIPSIKLFYKKEDETTAYTDGNSIVVNVANPVIQSGKTLEEKFSYLKGTVVHEVGHMLYTDFNELSRLASDISYKRIPEVSANLDTLLPSNFNDARDLLQKDLANGLITPDALFNFVHQFFNITEDGHLEDRISREYIGEAVQEMTRLQNHFFTMQENLETLDRAAESHPSELTSLGLAFLLTYAKYSGRIKKSDQDYNVFDSPVYKFAEPSLDLVYAATKCDSAPIRSDLTLAAFITMYPSLKAEIIRNIIHANVKYEKQDSPDAGTDGMQSPSGMSGQHGPMTINPQIGGGGQSPNPNQKNKVHIDDDVDQMSEEILKSLQDYLDNYDKNQQNQSPQQQNDPGEDMLDAESRQKWEEAYKKALEKLNQDLKDQMQNQTINDMDQNQRGKSKAGNSGNSLDDVLKEMENKKNDGSDSSQSGSQQGGSAGNGQAGGSSDGAGDKIEVGAPTLQDAQAQDALYKDAQAAAAEHDQLNKDAKGEATDLASQLEATKNDIKKKLGDPGLSSEERDNLQDMLDSIDSAISNPYWGRGLKDMDTSTTKLTPKKSELTQLSQAYNKMYSKKLKNGLSPIELGKGLADVLADMLSEITSPTMEVGTTSGNLSISQVVKNYSRYQNAPDAPYYQRLGAPLTEDFCRVAIVVDNSGSMGGSGNLKTDFARNSIVFLIEFCEELGIPYAVSFFSSSPDSNLDLTDFDKPFGEEEKYMMANTKLLDSRMGGTDLLPPLMNLYTRLKDVEDDMGTLLFVISDGETDNAASSIEMLRKLEEDRNVQSVIMTFPERTYSTPSTQPSSVYTTWSNNFGEAAPLVAATEGISMEAAIDEVTDMAARTLVDVPDITEAPDILADILFDKIHTLIMKARGVE